MQFEIKNGMVQGYLAEAGEKEAVIPEGVTGIGQRAFDGAVIETLRLPEGLNKIESMAFHACASLRELELPSTLQTVYSNAFSNCTTLTSVRLPEEMLHYGENLFSGCTALRRVEGVKSGSYAEYTPEDAVLHLRQSASSRGTILAGILMDSGVLQGGTLLECSELQSGKTLWALWLPVGEQSRELNEKVRDLFYSVVPFRFGSYDGLFRSMKESKNKLLYALLRLLYPVELSSEVEIMLRNLLRRGATECASYLIEDGRMKLLKDAVEAGLLDKADQAELMPLAEKQNRAGDLAAIFAGKREDSEEKSGEVKTLTPAQIKMLNNPVYARLMERKEKLRRASLARLQENADQLENLLREGVRNDNRAQVRYYLGSGSIDDSVLYECALLAMDNDDIYMLQDLIEAMHDLKPAKAGLLLEHAAVSGKTAVVQFLCLSLPEIVPYNRALGYAMRQADFEMAAAILERKDQSLKTAQDIRTDYIRLMNKPELSVMDRRIIDLGYVEYNYYDDDIRYMFKNCARNGLVGDEFYDTHYVLVKLAGEEERLEFIRKMADAGYFGSKELRYLCYLATDADEIPIAQGLVDMGVDGFDVRECSIIGNQQTVLDDLGDMFMSNPNRPSDEKFAFIISRLKPGEKLKMQVKYLLKTANVARALAILKHSSLENCEDVPMTVEYFIRHNSLEAVEIFCQWGKADECFAAAQAMENTEIVAWILNYQNEHGTRAVVDDRFDL